MRRVGRPTVRDEPKKLIAIRLNASPLRQNLFDQLEYRRQVLVLRFGQIEIFLAFFQAVVGIDFVFWNIDAAGIVRVGMPSVPPAALLTPPSFQSSASR